MENKFDWSRVIIFSLIILVALILNLNGIKKDEIKSGKITIKSTLETASIKK
ncbi:hypothetical protein [Haliovirga abyssi]|uniref:Uncharacterized protein n=1 Tax=Haliovirga abyssi TaxID=2996794 RepID=A0AAU9DAJ1_9FUSO|nr:hypothetical protein [Haliovirga abyssi]BDU50616.1 hypothetical protein HLVA_11850 [Haliovirga abyssi]